MKKFFMLTLAITIIFSNAIIAEAEDTNSSIKQGDYGPEVIELHQKLIELGLFGLRAESPYGPESAEAVKLLQGILGLDETGVVCNKADYDALIASTISPDINLATNTDKAVTVAPKGTNSWCNPTELYPTSELGLKYLSNNNISHFVVSFDWSAINVDIEVDASISFRYTGEDKTWYSPVGYFTIQAGDSNGHCEVDFEPTADMRLYGTGWCISRIGTDINRNIQITLSNFRFTHVTDGVEEW